MASHSRRQDRGIPSDVPDVSGSPESGVARFESVQEGLAVETDTVPRPAGFGEEASRATQSFATIDDYVVPDSTVAVLREVSLSIESNGEALANVGGIQYGPFTGATDVAIPVDPGRLTGGDRIEIKHQSTDGSSTTTQAQVVVLEV